MNDEKNAGAHLSAPMQTGSTPTGEWVSIEEAVLICVERGLHRTPKTVRKWASRSYDKDPANAEMTVRRQDTANGNFRWRIERISLECKIDQELELLQSSGQSVPENSTEPVHTGADASEPVRTGSDHQVSGLLDANPTEPVRTEPDGFEQKPPDDDFYKSQLEQKDQQITQLNNQLERRDEQIMTMLERDRETNILIQGLQRSLTNVIDVLPGARRQEGERSGQRHHDITPPVDTHNDIESYGV